MCRSMVDIQSATAEIRRRRKEERKKIETTRQNIMSASATQGGHIIRFGCTRSTAQCDTPPEARRFSISTVVKLSVHHHVMRRKDAQVPVPQRSVLFIPRQTV